MAASPRGWLLDTNVVSEIRKGARANAGVRAWAEAVPPVACFLSVVSVAEIRFGIERVADLGFCGGRMHGFGTARRFGSATASSRRTKPCCWPGVA